MWVQKEMMMISKIKNLLWFLSLQFSDFIFPSTKDEERLKGFANGAQEGDANGAPYHDDVNGALERAVDDALDAQCIDDEAGKLRSRDAECRRRPSEWRRIGVHLVHRASTCGLA